MTAYAVIGLVWVKLSIEKIYGISLNYFLGLVFKKTE